MVTAKNKEPERTLLERVSQMVSESFVQFKIELMHNTKALIGLSEESTNAKIASLEERISKLENRE